MIHDNVDGYSSLQSFQAPLLIHKGSNSDPTLQCFSYFGDNAQFFLASVDD
jgi:hypothetical protein